MRGLILFATLALLPLAGQCADPAAPAGAEQKRAVPGRYAELFGADTLPKALTMLQPGLAEAQLVASDYLLLDAPPIVAAGSVKVHLMSEIPGTDLLLVFNPAPQEQERVLLAVQEIDPLSKAEVNVSVRLEHTSVLLLVARAAGQWYKVTSEVKVAHKDVPKSKKAASRKNAPAN